MMVQQPPPIPEIPPPPFDPNLFFLSDAGGPVLVMIVALSLVAATVILWPLMRALGRRVESKGGADPALRGEIEQLQHRLGEVEVLQQRVAELEERIDFTERIVAQGREPNRLSGGR